MPDLAANGTCSHNIYVILILISLDWGGKEGGWRREREGCLGHPRSFCIILPWGRVTTSPVPLVRELPLLACWVSPWRAVCFILSEDRFDLFLPHVRKLRLGLGPDPRVHWQRLSRGRSSDHRVCGTLSPSPEQAATIVAHPRRSSSSLCQHS